jgi:hypothetical protein
MHLQSDSDGECDWHHEWIYRHGEQPRISTLSGSQIQNVGLNSFQVVILLGKTGSYSIKINNPNGGTSGTFAFGAAGPTITSVSPNPVTGSNSDQPFLQRHLRLAQSG